MGNVFLKVVIIFFSIIVVIALITFIIAERKKNERINPKIFPNFIKIENHCLEYIEQKQVEPAEYERCSKLIKNLNPNDDSYSADEWYKIIQRLGFDQPDLYLTQPATKQEYDRAMIEQKRLKEIQGMIIEKQIYESIVETQKMLDDLKNN